jgi:hypothetical protein
VSRLLENEMADPPVILTEWVQAVETYCAALEAGEATEEMRQRVREAWLPLRHEMAFHPSPFALKLMEDVFHSTH